MKIKQLLCNHKWEYLERPNDKDKTPTKVKCIKCDLKTKKYVNSFKAYQRAYLWCDCGNELFKGGDKIGIIESNFDKDDANGYICNRCGMIKVFNFNIAPVAIEVTNDYIMIKYLSYKYLIKKSTLYEMDFSEDSILINVYGCLRNIKLKYTIIELLDRTNNIITRYNISKNVITHDYIENNQKVDYKEFHLKEYNFKKIFINNKQSENSNSIFDDIPKNHNNIDEQASRRLAELSKYGFKPYTPITKAKFEGAIVANPLMNKNMSSDNINKEVFKNCVDFDFNELYLSSIAKQRRLIKSLNIAELDKLSNKELDECIEKLKYSTFNDCTSYGEKLIKTFCEERGISYEYILGDISNNDSEIINIEDYKFRIKKR